MIGVRTRVVILIGTLSMLSACGFPAWRDAALQRIMAPDYHPGMVSGGGSGTASQTVEFYSASGRHVGYGVIRGGSAEFFNVDGSRAGSGRIGR